MKKFLPVFLLICSLATARADQSFTIVMDGLQEVPPNASPGTGFGTAFFDSTALTISLSVSFSGLVSPTTVSHIHTGAVGFAGPVVVDTTSIMTPGATSGTVSGGPLAISATHVANLLAGDTYLNIHTTAFPGGEIRGQLIVVPEPSTTALVGLGIVGLGWKLRRKRRT
jgi:hypothetical protein